MSILVGKDTKVLCQGMGKAGTFHALQCREYGTQIVGGVTPGKGGTSKEGIPLFNTVTEAVAKTGANATMVFVPPFGAADAILEAADAGISLSVAIFQLSLLGIGQSTCIGIGGDPVIGMNQIDMLKLFQDDPGTEAILLMGEIGGTAEEEAAVYIKKHITKPVASFIAGQTAPPGKRRGHAGAIISGGTGSAADKIRCLEANGIFVARSPADLGITVQRMLLA